jgi:hypothetical protein
MGSTQGTQEETYAFETIDLPSKGAFYPEGSPLKSGTIDIRYMTAKHEDILTSTNLIQKGIVIDKLIDSLIATKGVSSNDLLTGDLNAVMVAARILGYGKDYPISVECPNCGEEVEEVFDLTTLGTVNEPVGNPAQRLTITLPISKATVELRILTRKDELDFLKEAKALQKASINVSSQNTAKLRAMIASVNGDSSKATIWKFVDTLLVRDSKFIKEEYKKIVPDVDFSIQVSCTCSDSLVEVRLPIGSDFFWPDA